MKASNFTKGLFLSMMSLGVGFLAIAIPFRIFDNLSGSGIKILFAVELMLYIGTALIFLAVQDRKNQQKKKEAQRHEKRQLKIKDVQENWYNIAA